MKKSVLKFTFIYLLLILGSVFLYVDAEVDKISGSTSSSKVTFIYGEF